MLAPLLLAALALAPPAFAQETAPSATRPTVVVRQSGEADELGDDDRALERALVRLRPGGGTLVLGPGRYVIRRALFLPHDLVLRGEPGAVLALPAPVLTAEAAQAGAKELVVAGAHEFADAVRVQILPPLGSEFFADGTTKALELQQVERVEGQKLVLHDALTLDVPAGSRVGYPHKLLWLNKDGRTAIEDLAFEGGRDAAIPMPGHSQRCAIWASAPWGFEEQRKGPPGSGVSVRRCRFSDWYGRAVALYNEVDGAVEDCTLERIDDEAIDLDHFVERFHIAGNTITSAPWGIVLNDASRNVVERNKISDCEIGIHSWWYEKTPRQGINEENVIRDNEVRGARQQAIYVGKGCVRYVVEKNRVEGEIVVVEPENTVRENTKL
ncbi:MAG: right-handed parallel beta-helix repeat-containing protein [Planctomycetes bacterium]|nr:right-handed parallel beta-helix repeat-containing protein [Planctomycetota bacterium]